MVELARVTHLQRNNIEKRSETRENVPAQKTRRLQLNANDNGRLFPKRRYGALERLATPLTAC